MFFLSAAVFAVALSSVSCSSDNNDDPDDYMIWDLYPFYISAYVVNSNGENMLDPKSPGYDSAFVSNSYATLQSKDYKLGEAVSIDIVPTRAFFTTFEGFIVSKADNGKVYGVVGPFLSDRTWNEEELVFHWGDGTTDTVVFSHDVYWQKKDHDYKEPFFREKYIFNGNDSTAAYKEKGVFELVK